MRSLAELTTLRVGGAPWSLTVVTTQSQLIEAVSAAGPEVLILGGGSNLLVSEDLDELLKLSDRILVMSEGKIVYESAIAEADFGMIGQRMAGH